MPRQGYVSSSSVGRSGPASALDAALVVVARGELPDGLAERAHRLLQRGGRERAGAQEAQRVAGEHGRVARREVHGRERALDARELAARATPRRGEARGLAQLEQLPPDGEQVRVQRLSAFLRLL